MGYVLDSTRKRQLRDTAAWQLSAATRHDGLFSAVAACALALLQKEARRRSTSRIGFAENELVVVVCAAIRRVVGPLQVVLGALLREDDVAKQLAMAGRAPRSPPSPSPC